MKKLSIEYVKSYFLNEGYTPLFNEYVRSKDILNVMCPEGHFYLTSFSNFKDLGRRCSVCKNRKKYTTEYVKEYFKSKGYILVGEYLRSRDPIKTLCPIGHTCYISFDNFKNKNRRCLTCYREGNKGKAHPRYGKQHSEETKIKLSQAFLGEKSSFWKGGISCEPYCQVWSDKEYKEAIRERDNHICQNPYCYKNDSRLHIHHIDYDKKNCGPNNLITVCGSCNSRANTDREWHIAWYQTIMNHKYGYEYK